MKISQIRAVLVATPPALEALLKDLPESLTLRNEGGATWSARDIVAHLVHGELEDWVPRAELILAEGTARPFDPFDPEGFRPLARGQQLIALVKRFAALRREGLTWLDKQAFTDEQLALRGTHPAFGEVTMHELLCTWATHDLTHLAQISRVISHQIAPHIGPWREYLPNARKR